jgi:hypothetical protein
MAAPEPPPPHVARKSAALSRQARVLYCPCPVRREVRFESVREHELGANLARLDY